LVARALLKRPSDSNIDLAAEGCHKGRATLQRRQAQRAEYNPASRACSVAILRERQRQQKQ
jgi:hypothetical protein